MALAERELKAYNELLGPFEDIFERNIGLLKSIAQKYYAKVHFLGTIEFDDFYQIASLALLESYRRYKNPTEKVPFTMHATYTIHHRIKRFLDTKVNLIHIPLDKRKLGVKHKFVSLDEPTKWDEEVVIEDLLCAAKDDETVDFVNEFLAGLKPKWKRFTLMRMNEYSLREIAESEGVTHQAISNSLRQVGYEYVCYNRHGRYRIWGEKIEFSPAEIGL